MFLKHKTSDCVKYLCQDTLNLNILCIDVTFREPSDMSFMADTCIQLLFCLCIIQNNIVIFVGTRCGYVSVGEDGQVKIWSRSGMLRSTLIQTGNKFLQIETQLQFSCWSQEQTSVKF